MSNLKASILAGSLVVASISSATTFSVTEVPAALGSAIGYDQSAGKINSFTASYNDVTQALSFSANFGPRPGQGVPTADGFHLVLSDGPNPKGTNNQLAIFYFDASKSLPTLTAYAYNGANTNSSYIDPNDRIGSSKVDSSFVYSLTNKNETDGSRTLGFSINATTINNHKPKPGWEGSKFGALLGIWFHPYAGLTTTYKDGYLSSLTRKHEGYVDGENLPTQSVPEPVTMAAFGAGLLALARRRKNS